MLSEFDRWVYFLDLLLVRKPDAVTSDPDGDDMDLTVILDALERRAKAGQCVKPADKGARVFRIAEVRIDKPRQLAVLLLRHCNVAAPDPVFDHVPTGQQRTVEMKDDEGLAHSAHLVLSLRPERANGTRHLALLEEVPGLSRGALQPILKAEFKASSPYQFTKNGTKEDCWLEPSLEGHASEQLRSELTTGKSVLQNVELIATRDGSLKDAGLDQIKEVKPVRNVKTLRVLQASGADGQLTLLNKLFQYAKDNQFDDIRVKYRTVERKLKTAKADLARYADAGDVLLLKSEHITGMNGLKQSCDSMHEGLLERMIGILTAARGVL